MSENTYYIYTGILVMLSLGVLFRAFGKKRFEKDAQIPFQDKQ